MYRISNTEDLMELLTELEYTIIQVWQHYGSAIDLFAVRGIARAVCAIFALIVRLTPSHTNLRTIDV